VVVSKAQSNLPRLVERSKPNDPNPDAADCEPRFTTCDSQRGCALARAAICMFDERSEEFAVAFSPARGTT